MLGIHSMDHLRGVLKQLRFLCIVYKVINRCFFNPRAEMGVGSKLDVQYHSTDTQRYFISPY
jgi:hypothetical protein